MHGYRLRYQMPQAPSALTMHGPYGEVGVQPPDASLGRMLNEAQAYLLRAPWYALSAGLAVILLVLGFGLLSEGFGGEGRA